MIISDKFINETFLVKGQDLLFFFFQPLCSEGNVDLWVCHNECQICSGCINQINDLCLWLQGLSGCEGAKRDPQAGRFNAPQYLLRQFLR